MNYNTDKIFKCIIAVRMGLLPPPPPGRYNKERREHRVQIVLYLPTHVCVKYERKYNSLIITF